MSARGESVGIVLSARANPKEKPGTHRAAEREGGGPEESAEVTPGRPRPTSAALGRSQGGWAREWGDVRRRSSDAGGREVDAPAKGCLHGPVAGNDPSERGAT